MALGYRIIYLPFSAIYSEFQLLFLCNQRTKHAFFSSRISTITRIYYSTFFLFVQAMYPAFGYQSGVFHRLIQINIYSHLWCDASFWFFLIHLQNQHMTELNTSSALEDAIDKNLLLINCCQSINFHFVTYTVNKEESKRWNTKKKLFSVSIFYNSTNLTQDMFPVSIRSNILFIVATIDDCIEFVFAAFWPALWMFVNCIVAFCIAFSYKWQHLLRSIKSNRNLVSFFFSVCKQSRMDH